MRYKSQIQSNIYNLTAQKLSKERKYCLEDKPYNDDFLNKIKKIFHQSYIYKNWSTSFYDNRSYNLVLLTWLSETKLNKISSEFSYHEITELLDI